jgi:hypothetical protein
MGCSCSSCPFFLLRSERAKGRAYGSALSEATAHRPEAEVDATIGIRPGRGTSDIRSKCVRILQIIHDALSNHCCCSVIYSLRYCMWSFRQNLVSGYEQDGNDKSNKFTSACNNATLIIIWSISVPRSMTPTRRLGEAADPAHNCSPNGAAEPGPDFAALTASAYKLSKLGNSFELNYSYQPSLNLAVVNLRLYTHTYTYLFSQRSGAPGPRRCLPWHRRWSIAQVVMIRTIWPWWRYEDVFDCCSWPYFLK